MTYIPSSAIISTGNSSTTPLSGGATFTGVGEFNTSPNVMLQVKTDAAGFVFFDFSPDGVNWDSTFPPNGFSVAAGISEFHTAVKGPRWFRVRFVNGAAAQSFLRLEIAYGVFSQGNLPLRAAIGADADATVVRPTNPSNETVLGLRSGETASLKFGFNNNIGTAGEEVIASFGGTFTPLVSATTLTLVSANTADTLAGNGARSLLIQGIDANRKSQFEFINLNGATPVVTVNTWLGVNRIVVYSSGSSKANVGNITCTATTGGTTQAHIPPFSSITQQLIFHTQAGFDGLINRVSFNVLKTAAGTAPRVTISMRIWNPNITDTNYLIRRFKIDTSVTNDIERKYELPIRLDPTDVVWFTLETDQNNTIVDGEVDIIEVVRETTQ